MAVRDSFSTPRSKVGALVNNWGAPAEDASQGEGSATVALNAAVINSPGAEKPANKDVIIAALISQLDTSNALAKTLLKQITG